MADDTTEGAGEEKPDASAQMDLFAERTEKVAQQLEATAANVAALAERAAQTPPPAAAAPQTPRPERFTEEQVLAAVDRKEITLAQGLALLSRQAKEEAKEEARKEVEQKLSAERGQKSLQSVVSKIQAYQQAIPGLRQRGSAEWNSVVAQYTELVEEGHKPDQLTELAALKLVFGKDPGKHEEVRESTRERVARTTETPSAGTNRTRTGASRPTRSVESDPDLPPSVRDHIGKMIRIGQYKGWDDPKVKSYADRYKSKHAGAGA